MTRSFGDIENRRVLCYDLYMKYLKGVSYFVLQCTWGFLQSPIGLILFFRFIKCQHSLYHGSVVTYHNGNFGGVSLGLFIFVNGSRGEKAINEMRVHEYGHTVQSLLLGPLYLFVIGIPSLIWCDGKKFRKLREKEGVSYYAFYPESGANFFGSRATGEPEPEYDGIDFKTLKERRRSRSEN